MAINTPGSEDALGKAILARTPNVIHDLVASIFNDGFANAPRNVVEHLVPTNLFPMPCSAFPARFKG